MGHAIITPSMTKLFKNYFYRGFYHYLSSIRDLNIDQLFTRMTQVSSQSVYSSPVSFHILTLVVVTSFSAMIQRTNFSSLVRDLDVTSIDLLAVRINASIHGPKFDKIRNEMLLDIPPEDRNKFSELLLSIRSNSTLRPKKLSLDQSTELIQIWTQSKTSFYPEPNDKYFEILDSLRDSKIMKTDVVSKGSQLKLLLTFQGNIEALFKPKRYKLDHVITGGPVAGFDRHNSEIVSFHISRLLGMRRAPFTTGRKLDFADEILQVSTDRLRETISNRSCFYGKCYYCNPKETVCSDQCGKVDGSVILMLPNNHLISSKPNIFRKSFKDGKIKNRESKSSYCSTTGKYWLDLVDVSIFDFLIQNSDRHHLEMNEADEILLIDSGKGFGNPFKNELSILFPLIQCCVFRKSMLDRLILLHERGFNEILQAMLRRDPLYPLLSQDHQASLEVRLKIILLMMYNCMNKSRIRK